MFRSLLYHKYGREFQVQDVLYLHSPSVTVDSSCIHLFTVKILNSLHVETLSANRYRTTK